MKAGARPHGTTASAAAFPPGRTQAVWVHQLEATKGKAGTVLGHGTAMRKPALPACGIKESEESKAPSAKPDQSPAEICVLPVKETGRGDVPGSRGLG